jgi:uncharacterized protein (DUF927 family)
MVNLGAYVPYGSTHKALTYLNGNKPKAVTGFSRTGWFTVNGRSMYALPEQIFGVDNKDYVFASEIPSHKMLRQAGTLESWKLNVASAAIGNPLVMFALGIGFAAPLMHLLEVDGGGFNYTGPSGTGKSTLLQVSASIYGNAVDPATASGRSFIQQWNTTDNALEATAQAYNDLLLPIDEIGMKRGGSNFAATLYMLASGAAKQAMNSNREVMPTSRWRVMVLSSGEHSVAAEIERVSQRTPPAGPLVRFIDIQVDEGIFPAWSSGDVGSQVTQLKEACSRHYGVAAKPYLELLVDYANDHQRLEALRQRYESLHGNLVGRFKGAKQEQVRAMKRFALVASALTLAIEAGCLDCSNEDAMTAVQHAATLWIKHNPSISNAERGLEQFKHFLASKPNRIGNVHELVQRGGNLVGYRDDKLGRYLILTKSMREVCDLDDAKGVIKLLDTLGVLVRNNTKNNQQGHRDTSKVVLKDGTSVSGYLINYQLTMQDEVEPAPVAETDEEIEPWLEALFGK